VIRSNAVTDGRDSTLQRPATSSGVVVGKGVCRTYIRVCKSHLDIRLAVSRSSSKHWRAAHFLWSFAAAAAAAVWSMHSHCCCCCCYLTSSERIVRQSIRWTSRHGGSRVHERPSRSVPLSRESLRTHTLCRLRSTRACRCAQLGEVSPVVAAVWGAQRRSRATRSANPMETTMRTTRTRRTRCTGSPVRRFTHTPMPPRGS
jgi:hypothetical protein